MTAVKVADLFGEVGFKVDFSQLDRFQQRLAQAKQQLLALRDVSSKALIANTNIDAVRALNAELQKTLNITRQLSASGVVKVRPGAGPKAAGAAGGGGRGRNSQTGGASAGLMSGLGFGRASPLARNFLGGFTTALAIKSLYDAQVGLDTIRVGLESILKPGEKLGDMMGWLRGQADKLGFEFSTSAIEYTKLAASANAAGVSTQQTKDIFIAAEEASRVFHLSVADTEGVLKAFTQILSKGKVEAQELRNQLGNRLPGAFGLMAKALGVTTAQLDVMMKQGQVMAADALPKFAKTMHDTYAGVISEASNTAQAQLNRFLNAWFDFRVQIMQSGLDEVFALALEGAGKALKVLVPLVHALAVGIRMLITPIHALLRILDVFFKAVPTAIVWIGILTAAVWALSTAQLAAIAPWVLGAAAIGAILILIDDLATALRGGESVIGDMAASGDGLASVLSNLLLFFGQIVVMLSEGFAAWVSGDNLLDAMADSARKLQDFLLGILQSLANIADWISGGRLGKFGEYLGGKAADATEFVQALPGQASDAMSSASKTASRIVFGGAQVQVNVPPGSDAQAVGEAVRKAMDEHTDAQMREARSQFGALESY